MNRLKRVFLVAMQVLVIMISLAGAAWAPEAGQFCALGGARVGTNGNGATVVCSASAGANGAGRWVY